MSDFKKNFNQRGRRQGGFSRPSFGAQRRPQGRSFNGPSESFKADCSKCGDVCEVPFRPNGKKPVFCRNCFVRDDAREQRPSSRDFSASSAAERPALRREAAPDPRIDALQRELAEVNGKLDTLIQSLESAAYSSILTRSVESAAAAAPAKKAAAEKPAAAKKAAPKKPATKKAPAKKTVKK